MCPGNTIISGGLNITKVSGSNKNDSYDSKNTSQAGDGNTDRIPRINGFKATIKSNTN
jgi:hypothetical protein